MLFLPVALVVNLYLRNERMRAELDKNWYCKPLNTICSLDPVPIPPTFFVVLDVIIYDKDIAFIHLLKKTEPGDITRLKYPDPHFLCSSSCIDMQPLRGNNSSQGIFFPNLIASLPSLIASL